MSEIVSDLIMQHIPPNHKRTRSGVSFNCPMCTTMGETRNDTRGRGGLKIFGDGSFVYNCFNCGFKTRHDRGGYISKKCMNLLIKLGINKSEIPLKLRLLKTNEINHIAEVKNHIDLSHFKEIKLPYNAKTIEYWAEFDNVNDDLLQTVQYLYDRGTNIFKNHTFFWTPETKNDLCKRIIVPFYYENKIVGWVGRYNADNPPKGTPKYYGFTPKDYLFNVDLLKNHSHDTIIVVEGILDAISINGVAVLGNEMTENQIRLLKLSGKKIIVMPDRNKAGKRLLSQAIEQGFYVSIPEWNINLPGSEDTASAVKYYGLFYTLESIYKSSTLDKNTIMTRFNLVSMG